MTQGIRPFFCYYGGKWRDAVKHYPKPRFDLIVEPFAGSAGYSLRYPDKQVILCDSDPVIAGLWRYLIAVSAEEILNLPDVPPGATVDNLSLNQEARWLIGFWLNKGVQSPRKSPSAWMRSGIRPGSFWGDAVRHRIANQLSAIRHWEIREADYREVSFSVEATWFIDPPYQTAPGRHYRKSDLNYQDLSLWCRDRCGQVVVCDNEHADWLPFSNLPQSKTTSGSNRSTRAIEACWISDSRAGKCKFL